MKKRIASILLIFIFLAPVLSGFTWIHYQRLAVRHAVKRRIKKGLDKDDLVVLTFSNENSNNSDILKWKHDKEFEYNGEMYDIICTDFEQDSVSYWCWRDNEETVLNKKLSHLLTYALDHNQDNQNNKSSLTSYFKSLYFYQTVPQKNAKIIDFTKSNFAYQFNIKSHNCDGPFLPPQLLAA